MNIYLIVFVSYFAFLLIVGYLNKSRNTTGSDYFRSGGSASWWVVGASVLMSGISAYTFTGASGVAFEAGWSVLAIYITGVAGYFLSIITGPWFRQLRATTAPEVIRMRFDSFTQKLVAIIVVLQAILMSGLPIYALAAFCTGVFGFNLQITILTVGVVVTLYATLGGRWAILSCDFLQGILLFFITLLVFGLAIFEIGGFSSLFQKIQEAGLSDDFSIIKQNLDSKWADFSLLWIFALLILNLFVVNSLTAAPRFFSVRDGREARKAAIFSAIIFLLGSIIWFIPPIVARLTFPEIVLSVNLPSPREAAYAIFALEMLPPSLMALMLLGIFAATASSIDSGLNANSAILVRDILPWARGFIGLQPISTRNEVHAGRISTLILGFIIIILALFYSNLSAYGIFDLMLKIIGLFSMPVTIPFLLCLFIQKVPRWSGWATLLFSVSISLSLFLFEIHSGERVPFALILIVNTFLTISFFIFTMSFWNKNDKKYVKKVNKFFKLMHTPIDESEIPEFERDGTTGRVVIAKSLFILAALLLLLSGFSIGKGGSIFLIIFTAFAATFAFILYKKSKSK